MGQTALERDKIDAPIDGVSTKTDSRGRFYRPELDLLRLLAFLLVFLYHSFPSQFLAEHPRLRTPVMAASGGMEVFFLLSAYLITELLLRERERTGQVHLKSFYMRRILRIWPLYYLVLGLAMLGSRWSGLQWGPFAAFALLAGNWWPYLYLWGGTGVVGPLWSISIEEQFYLAVPTLFRFGARRALYVSSGLFLVLANLTLYHLGGTAHTRQTAWTHTLVQFQFFALGTLIALSISHRKLRIPGLLRPVLLLCGLRALCFYNDHAYAGPGGWLVAGYASLAVGAVSLFFSVYGMPVPRWANPLLYLGRISYGLYVFHLAMLTFVTYSLGRAGIGSLAAVVPVSLLLTIGVSALSYRYFEAPFLRLKRRFTYVPSR